jgi:hypothetical protein
MIAFGWWNGGRVVCGIMKEMAELDFGIQIIYSTNPLLFQPPTKYDHR